MFISLPPQYIAPPNPPLFESKVQDSKVTFEFLEKSFVEFLHKLSDAEKEEFYLPFAVDQWIKQGIAQVQVKQAKCEWMGVTYKEDKPRVEESITNLVNAGFYPSPLSMA